jgi:hypothetical protein
MRNTVMLLLLLSGAAFPYVVGYHVEPVKALWSGWTASQFPNNYVEQQVVACWDSLDRVELFAGDKGNGEPFNVQVKDSAMEQIIAASADTAPTQSWAWLSIPVSPYQGHKPVRGRTYKVVVTRSSGPITFGYDPRDPRSV